MSKCKRLVMHLDGLRQNSGFHQSINVWWDLDSRVEGLAD